MKLIEEELFNKENPEGKKEYKKPEIIHEMLLETRAGSVVPPEFAPPWEFGG